MKLYYYYDKSADVLYWSQGKPSTKDRTQEFGDDVVLRFDAKTRKVKGFTVLNFAKRAHKNRAPIALPLETNFTLSASLR